MCLFIYMASIESLLSPRLPPLPGGPDSGTHVLCPGSSRALWGSAQPSVCLAAPWQLNALLMAQHSGSIWHTELEPIKTGRQHFIGMFHTSDFPLSPSLSLSLSLSSKLSFSSICPLPLFLRFNFPQELDISCGHPSSLIIN